MRAAGRGDEARQALRAMRSARRRRFVEQLDDVMEVIYRIYVVGIFGGFGLAMIAGAVNDADLSAASVEDLARDGPAILGLGVSLAVLAGLRSGARGGPLAIEAAEVQYVLLAPIDRRLALRPAAVRQMRIATLVGAVLGAIAGNFAFRQLPGSPLEWLACLALFGAAVPLCTLGCALLASGRRIEPVLASSIGAALFLWGLADALFGVKTSPTTMLGALATYPLQSGGLVAFSVGGLVITAAVAGLGFACLGGLSLDAARRRASLTAVLRFSASVQDLRTVVLLRRQLASERPRRRPWIRLRAPTLAQAPIRRRGWQSLLRWPVPRATRALAVGVIAGLLAAGALSGSTPLAAVVGVVLLVAALDFVEPLAQEVDHPLRRDLLPIEPDTLITRHLIAPALGMGLVVLTGVLVVMTFGAPGTAAGVGVVMIFPTAFILLCCAALSVTNDPYQYILTPGFGYAQTALPLVVAMAAVAAPLLAAREASELGTSPVTAAALVEIALLVVAGVMVWWLGQRVRERAEAVRL